ncbi:uncharacterized protein LOC131652808 isoform X3 [Vicia villosa]|uniref:uncharacterized protein LOC131652808 isoform X3 n=1 Tax=Vicia villosa TaxID=3911 RepID=UPI00273BB39C|nr:uncharacterized protein LOC131652808 isoform X3 [Vicia villosa]XP_058778754.1 uncharacterized protein LOC131652808 isoform X3 [Vicia villosa]XP_058778755.1 uncharacterized protein LOC131652808 isoform X3 [Vicia villosa]XP_058778756.1 uncharacterized protein LOC131652808 isoform X3 [Vicia villosa]XP_058778757.1 uncharacterized protein LOC131652808 isoform X3 [Vicia villosa]XP_058778758.1 uncharacterized protein LOC131652808 isoform X3 [Vicia villosa]XP_058778759.1 uncharacterized protein LO
MTHIIETHNFLCFILISLVLNSLQSFKMKTMLNSLHRIRDIRTGSLEFCSLISDTHVFLSLQLLQEPGSYVGEVVKAIDKNKVLVKQVCIGSSSCSVNTYTKRLFPGRGENISEGRDIAPAPVQPFHPKIKIRRGVLATECADVMQQFFQLRRKNKKEEVLKEPSCLPVTHHHPAKLLNKIHDIIHVIFCL